MTKRNPTPTPTISTVELLDSPPQFMRRPLALLDGQAYAGVWPWTKATLAESIQRGKVVRHDPPLEEVVREMHVLRQDGTLFGRGGDEPLSNLHIIPRLTLPPFEDKLWSITGIQAYRNGYRADPVRVHGQMVSLFTRFVSFDRSLASQQVMAEFMACFTLSTYFLDAFLTAPILWPNGGYGSGKTKLGTLACEVAFLGMVLLAGSTYPCLRDLADMGATLMFDDAETLTDPKLADSEKRNLFLASNRRGAKVAVKESLGNGIWQTRERDAYFAKIFTATILPDPIFASRATVVPLNRTADASKANADVLDYSLWPFDRHHLLDDLWALGLAHLPALPRYEAAVNKDAPLVGRNLEPWRSILAVALWLDDLGQAGLYERMVNLAIGYQKERSQFETLDLTKLVVRALGDLVAPKAPSAPNAPTLRPDAPIDVEVAKITAKVAEIAAAEELGDDDTTGYISDRKVGKVLTSLRLRQAPKHSGQGRRRRTSLAEVDAIARAYGLVGIPLLEGAQVTGVARTGQMGPGKEGTGCTQPPLL